MSPVLTSPGSTCLWFGLCRFLYASPLWACMDVAPSKTFQNKSGKSSMPHTPVPSDPRMALPGRCHCPVMQVAGLRPRELD